LFARDKEPPKGVAFGRFLVVLVNVIVGCPAGTSGLSLVLRPLGVDCLVVVEGVEVA
jgi:hypothetical protein